jgi:glutathione S-transferase
MESNTVPISSPTLHHLSSSQSLRVLWALEELAAANDGFHYTLRKYSRERGAAPKEMKSVFPLGKSPILTVEPSQDATESEETVVTETRLILQYLSDEYANEIWEPVSAKDKTRNTFFQEFANNTLAMKADFALIFDVIPQHLPTPFRQLVKLLVKPIVDHWIEELQAVYHLMEDALSEERPWFAGEKIGLADFNISWGMDLAFQRGFFNPTGFPKLMAWHMTIRDRPAYQRALKEGGTYDLVNFI